MKNLFEAKTPEDLRDNFLKESSNAEVINMFIYDSFPKNKRPRWGTKNLVIAKQYDGTWALINYNTPLLYRDKNDNLYFNSTKYSMSTTTIQNIIKRYLPPGTKEVSEEEINKVMP